MALMLHYLPAPYDGNAACERTPAAETRQERQRSEEPDVRPTSPVL
jgi:hypothetical protein